MLFKPDLATVKAAASAEAERLLPPYYPCREDLVANTPTDLVLRADGQRVAGTVNVSDIIPGSVSPAIWTYYPTMIALAVMTFIVGVMAAYLGAWLPLSSIAEAWRAGSGVMGSLGYALKITVVGWMLWGTLPAMGALAQMYYWYLLLSEQEASRDFYRIWTMAASIIVVLCIVLPFVGPLGCACTSLLSIIGFRLYITALEKSRDDILRDISHDTRTASILKGRLTMEEARKEQAQRSLSDKSNLVPLGESTDVLRRDGDLLTADQGTLMCASLLDMENWHLGYKGMSGTGKTTRGLKPLVRWVRAASRDPKNGKRWGCMVFDPAKNLAEELKDDLDVVVSPLTHRLNILRGLEPEIASMTIMQLRSKGVDEGGWQAKTEACFRHSLRMVKLCEQAADENGIRVLPQIHYSLPSAKRWAINAEWRKEVMAQLYRLWKQGKLPQVDPPDMQYTWEYWCVEWEEMHEEAKSSITGILTQWIDALVGHPEMQAWCVDESSIDLLDFVCREGGFVGINCPPTTYGVGGVIATTLIRAALQTRILQRTKFGGGTRAAWEAAGENDVLIPIDEYGSGAMPGDVAFATAARSLGGHLCIAYQVDGMLDEPLGGAGQVEALLSNIHARVTFKVVEKDDSLRSMTESCIQAGMRERWFPDDSNVAHAPLLELTRMEMSSGLKDASRNRLINLAGSFAGVMARRKHMLQTNHRDQNDMALSNPLRAVATLRGTTRITSTIEANELLMQMDRPGIALVSYPRAGVQRRGVCYMLHESEWERRADANSTVATMAHQPALPHEMPVNESVSEPA